MGIRLGAHGLEEVGHVTRLRGLARALLTILLLVVVVGCGARHAEQASTGAPSEGAQREGPTSTPESQAKTTVVASIPEPAAAPRRETKPLGPINRIRLSEKGCVQFEPHWTIVRLGQSLTWKSELKSTVAIYISSGAFDRERFVVRPGATVSTGPARTSGRFALWTEPAACRDMPLGVRLAGPGLSVEPLFLASAPGPR